jgi:hypothetical protein
MPMESYLEVACQIMEIKKMTAKWPINFQNYQTNKN